MHTNIHAYIHVHTYIHSYMHTCIYIHTYTHTYIHVHTYIHTYTCIHTVGAIILHTPAIKVFGHLNWCRNFKHISSGQIVSFQFNECNFGFDKVYWIISYLIKLIHAWVNTNNAWRINRYIICYLHLLLIKRAGIISAPSSVKMLDKVKNDKNNLMKAETNSTFLIILHQISK